MVLNLIIKELTCETVTVRLDPYDMECLTLQMEDNYLVVKHNEQEITKILVEEP